MAFYNVEIQRRSSELLTDDDTVFTGALRGIEDAVLVDADVKAALALVSTPRAREAFLLHAQGYSHREIADRLGIADEKKVENMLVYQRSRIRKAS